MLRRTQFAPTTRTIIVALVLILVGVLGTLGRLLPEMVGIGAFVVATAILLLGLFIDGI